MTDGIRIWFSDGDQWDLDVSRSVGLSITRQLRWGGPDEIIRMPHFGFRIGDVVRWRTASSDPKGNDEYEYCASCEERGVAFELDGKWLCRTCFNREAKI